MKTPQSSWRHIAEQACTETDSAKLLVLVSELCQAFDGEKQEKSRQEMTHESETI